MSRIAYIGVSLALASTLCLGRAQVPSDQRQSALSLEQQGSYAEAEAAWTAILKLHPRNPEPYAHIGLLEAHQEHYKEAVSSYRKALALDPKMPGLRLDLALALFKAGQLDKALPEFQALLRSVPRGSPDAQRFTILAGMCSYGLARYQESALYLQQAADRDPNNPTLLLSLAHSYLWSGQYQKVLGVYHRLLEISPDSAEVDMLAGEAYDGMKNSNGAIHMFRTAVSANPRTPDVHFGLGYLLWTQHQYDEAVEQFLAELANDPGHVQSQLYLGDTYIQLNRPADAALILHKVVALDASLALAHLDLGILAADAGHNDEALREFLVAEKIDPEDVNVHWRLGRLYRAMGRNDEARSELDKARNLTRAADQNLYRKMPGGAPVASHNADTAGK